MGPFTRLVDVVLAFHHWTELSDLPTMVVEGIAWRRLSESPRVDLDMVCSSHAGALQWLHSPIWDVFWMADVTRVTATDYFS